MDASGVLPGRGSTLLSAVPRSLFLPDLIWPFVNGECLSIDRADDPVAWQHWADSDAAIVTQWDEGTHTGPQPGHVPTSSASAPSLVAGMLADLDLQPGERVVDLGVGTGWTTALLSARTGDHNVLGVEIDPAVADAATQRLHAAGFHPAIVVADGADWSAPGPGLYDKVQCTYAVQAIPPGWIAQTRPGGLIVAPWRTGFTHGGAVVRLVVGEDATATGRFTLPAEFMQSRSERRDFPAHTGYLPSQEWPPGTVETATTLRPWQLWDSPQQIVSFVLGVRVPGVTHSTYTETDGTVTTWLYSTTDTSWAVAYFDDDPAAVYQGGRRRLWEELEAAYRWWSDHGRPRHQDLALTVDAHGRQRVTLARSTARADPVAGMT